MANLYWNFLSFPSCPFFTPLTPHPLLFSKSLQVVCFPPLWDSLISCLPLLDPLTKVYKLLSPTRFPFPSLSNSHSLFLHLFLSCPCSLCPSCRVEDRIDHHLLLRALSPLYPLNFRPLTPGVTCCHGNRGKRPSDAAAAAAVVAASWSFVKRGPGDRRQAARGSRWTDKATQGRGSLLKQHGHWQQINPSQEVTRWTEVEAEGVGFKDYKFNLRVMTQMGCV